MTTVEVDEDGANGLTAVVVAVVEILIDALEREAIRRMESGRLSDEEIERLGSHLATLEADLERLKDDQDVGEQVDKLRTDLDSLVTDAVRQVDREERGRTAAGGRPTGTVDDTRTNADGSERVDEGRDAAVGRDADGERGVDDSDAERGRDADGPHRERGRDP